MAGCVPCGARRSSAPTFRSPATSGGAAATQAGSATWYEVVSGRGTPTGRKFSTLAAAAAYARRIGGTTRPV